jgi:hypothetical protein
MTNAYWNNEKYYEYLCTIRNSRCAYYNFFSVRLFCSFHKVIPLLSLSLFSSCVTFWFRGFCLNIYSETVVSLRWWRWWIYIFKNHAKTLTGLGLSHRNRRSYHKKLDQRNRPQSNRLYIPNENTQLLLKNFVNLQKLVLIWIPTSNILVDLTILNVDAAKIS